MKQLVTVILIILFACRVYSQQTLNQEIDSIKMLLKGESLADTTKAYLYNDLSYLHSRIDPSEVRRYARKALEYSDEDDPDKFLARSYLMISRGYSYENKYDSALIYARISESIANDIQHTISIVDAKVELAVCFKLLGQYEKAFKWAFESLNIADSIGDTYRIAVFNLDIGEMYRDQHETENAVKHLQDSYEAFKELGIKGGMMAAKGNLALAYKQADAEKALATYEEILDEFGQLFGKNDSAKVYSNLGNILIDLERYDEAEDLLYKALELRKQLSFPSSTAYCYKELSEISLRKEEWTKVIYFGELALEIADEIEDVRLQEMLTKKLAIANFNQGNFRKAYSYLSQNNVHADSISSDERIELSNELATKYETEKKEQQIVLQDEQLARKEAELSNQSILRNGLIGGVIFLLAIVGLFYRNQRIKSSALNEKESLLKEIHHRVKNNLQVISSLLNMQSREAESDEMLDVIQEGQSRVKAMALIHQKLYQTDNLSEIDFQEYAEELHAQLASLYKRKDLTVDDQINASNLKLDIDTAIPLGLIMNELISNAYKYAFKGVESGSLKIDLKRIDSERLQLEVADDGQGLPANFKLENISSLGLKLVNILTKQLKGTLDYKSDGGAKFLISFSDLKMEPIE